MTVSKHALAISAVAAVAAGVGCRAAPSTVVRNDPCPVPAASRSPARRLDREAIAAGVRAVHHRLEACAVHFRDRGTVKVLAVVLPSGRVEALEILETPGRLIARCVATAIRSATFDATREGGTFTYPFVFR